MVFFGHKFILARRTQIRSQREDASLFGGLGRFIRVFDKKREDRTENGRYDQQKHRVRQGTHDIRRPPNQGRIK